MNRLNLSVHLLRRFSSINNSAKMDQHNSSASCNKKPFRVSIEGNIGCGKSTLIQHFAAFPDVDAHTEPIDLWRDVKGHNLLNLLYKDLNRWNFTFQNYVQLSRLQIQTKPTSKRVQIFERSVQNNRYCFVEMAHKSKFLEDPEYHVLCKWFEWIQDNMNIGLDLIVYLRSTPEIVYERIHQRNRVEESSVSLQYLKDLHEAYDQWLLYSDNVPAPVLQLDVDQELEHVINLYHKNEQLILGQGQV